MQSANPSPVLCRPIGGGSVALQAACDCPIVGAVRITGLTPDRSYLLAGATHRSVTADAGGEALVTVQPGAPALITLVPVL